jgi:DNA-binding CsgD family transcriptional regulator
VAIVRISCLFFLIIPALCAKAKYIVEGRILIDETWDSVIYLSAINSLNHLNTASENFIVNFSLIDKDGRFKLTGENLPDQDRLYRLHLVKKGDPISTIIIGGKDENHIHFIMTGDAHITGLAVNNAYLFNEFVFTDGAANTLLAGLLNMIRDRENLQGFPSETNRKYHLDEFHNSLRTFADTCSNSLVSLLALVELDIEQDFSDNSKFYKEFADELKLASPSPYIDEFTAQVAFLEFQTRPSPRTWLIVMPILVFSGLVFYGYLRRKTKSFPKRKDLDRLEKSLSYREQRIFKLIIDGKSNKEISQLLHIEVSTVKSHVRNIYSKLGIRSRKEALSLTTHHSG